jgi:hypothetical protein
MIWIKINFKRFLIVGVIADFSGNEGKAFGK